MTPHYLQTLPYGIVGMERGGAHAGGQHFRDVHKFSFPRRLCNVCSGYALYVYYTAKRTKPQPGDDSDKSVDEGTYIKRPLTDNSPSNPRRLHNRRNRRSDRNRSRAADVPGEADLPDEAGILTDFGSESGSGACLSGRPPPYFSIHAQ